MAPFAQRRRPSSRSLRPADRDTVTDDEFNLPFLVWLERSRSLGVSSHGSYEVAKRDRKNHGGRRSDDGNHKNNNRQRDSGDNYGGNGGYSNQGGGSDNNDDGGYDYGDHDNKPKVNGGSKNGNKNGQPGTPAYLSSSTITTEPSTTSAGRVTVTISNTAITVTQHATTTVVFPTTLPPPILNPASTFTGMMSISSQPRKGINDATESPAASSPTGSGSATPTGTALPNTTSAAPDSKHHKDDDGPSKTAEHVLIGAGSIGTFIAICLIGWFVYRMIKKGWGRKFWDGLAAKLTWIPGWNRRPWARIDEPESAVAEIPYSGKPTSLLVPTKAPHQPSQSVSSNPTTQDLSSEASLTFRSKMSDPFFNKSEPATQSSDAYDPAHRQANRISELSSLSSGFGDGDIVIPESFVRPPPQAAPNLRQSNNLVGRFSWHSRSGNNRDTVYTQTSEDSPARFRTITSWVNQQTGRIRRAQQRAGDGEEVPPVPGLPGVPGVPMPNGMPPEHRYTMMLDDEEPRRADPPTKS